MNSTTREKINALLQYPDKLLQKKPFTRGASSQSQIKFGFGGASIGITGTVKATLPDVKKEIVPQSQFPIELDPFSHRVLFDENVPSITIKAKKGGFLEIEQYRMSVPFQVLILDKQVRHLCVNRMNHTLLNTSPSEQQKNYFIRIKQAWAEKNMEGAKTKFVQQQKSYGDAALLYMMSDGKLVTKNICYDDGYTIISHKNDEGKHILECLYYAVTDENGNTIEYIDCYDDEYITRFTNESYIDGRTGGVVNDGWRRYEPVKHGFSENPLITKRGEVAWNRGQAIIESYEALYNTFIVIQKRHGWGALYVKGKFNQNAKKIAGSIVLNDTSLDPNADAKYLNPPSPQNMIETLELMEYTIQKATGTTFILPKDIRFGGDTSGLAIELTQELDMATAQDGVIEWQNVANKMMRLFKEGLAMELINTGEEGYAEAKTDFEKLRIHSEFVVWKPKSEEAHNQMLSTLHGAGGISTQTFVEANTVSTPDEMARIQKEHDLALQEQARLNAQNTSSSEQNSNNNTDEDL